MAVARLYIRISIDGKQQYARAVFLPNGNLKPNYATVEGKPQRFPDGMYHLRYSIGGTRRWESLKTTDHTIAIQRYRIKLNELETPAAKLPSPTSAPEPELEPVAQVVGITVADAITTYLKETATHKSRKTLAAYSIALKLFEQSCSKTTLHSLTRDDAMNFVKFLRDRGNAPRTVHNRAAALQFFLHHYKLPSLLVGKDVPKFTDKKVRAYNGDELGKMLSVSTEDEHDLLLFFVCTGVREQEAQYACWPDVDLIGKTYKVTEHRDLGFVPKDKEEGSVPLADVLVDRLIERRKRHPKARLIFPGKRGRPDGHLLRIVKRLALDGGVNCGQCVNRKGLPCSTHPVCSNVGLHKLRKTYATELHRSGVPARVIQRFLRHSSLDTTERYLDASQNEQTVAQVNNAFGGFGGAA